MFILIILEELLCTYQSLTWGDSLALNQHSNSSKRCLGQGSVQVTRVPQHQTYQTCLVCSLTLETHFMEFSSFTVFVLILLPDAKLQTMCFSTWQTFSVSLWCLSWSCSWTLLLHSNSSDWDRPSRAKFSPTVLWQRCYPMTVPHVK